MTNYIHGQSAQAKLASLHIENRELRAALTAALNDLNRWRGLFYAEREVTAGLAKPINHGKTTAYRNGCRCEPCMAAESASKKRQRENRKKKPS